MAPGTLLKHLLLISLFLNWYFFISKLVLLYFEIGISLFLNLYFFTSKLVFLYFEIGISLFLNWHFLTLSIWQMQRTQFTKICWHLIFRFDSSKTYYSSRWILLCLWEKKTPGFFVGLKSKDIVAHSLRLSASADEDTLW